MSACFVAQMRATRLQADPRAALHIAAQPTLMCLGQ
jgi:hypothetical protein